MGDKGRRTASHEFLARVVRRGSETGQAPVRGPGHARPDLSDSDANVDPSALGSPLGHDPGEDFYINEFLVPASLAPKVAVDRPSARSGRGFRERLFTVLTGIGFAATVFIGTLLLIQMFLSPPSPKAPTERADTAAQVERPAAVSEKPPSSSPPRLTSLDAATLEINQAVSLNMSLLGTADGACVLIKGLLSGSVVSGGRPLGEGAWQVDLARIEDVKVRPPRGFVGPMDLVLELRLADDTIVNRRSVRLEWVAPNRESALAPADTQNSTAKVGPSDPGSPMRPGQRQAVASLLARGKELLRNRDFSSARLILRRAAEAGDAEAALTLGATYDPNILTRLGLRSQVADVELAVTWYKKAQELGSTEASSRLNVLTPVPR
jgi:hypothetical protein